jgi:proteasome assembly chaperone (PAC2) family protein
MGIKLVKEPELENPVMIAGWPGIGNIGLVAVDHLRNMLDAEEFGEIEPWEFFYPKRVLIRKGEILGLEFPTNKFYFKQTGKQGLIIFMGEEQPADGGGTYAEGSRAYRMANLVLDIATKFGCSRVYSSGAAVAPIHHTMKSRVWAVPNSEALVPEIRDYHYPKASKSVLEVFCDVLGLEPDLQSIDKFALQQENEIEKLYERLPEDIRGQLEKLKEVAYTKQAEAGAITEEDKRKILENIDKLFKTQPPKEG